MRKRDTPALDVAPRKPRSNPVTSGSANARNWFITRSGLSGVNAVGPSEACTAAGGGT